MNNKEKIIKKYGIGGLELAKEIFNDIDNQILRETGRNVIRFKEIREKYGVIANKHSGNR